MNKNIQIKAYQLALGVILLALWVALGLFFMFRLSQANQGDLNHDGKVNVSDLSIMAHHYGKKDQ